MHRFIRRKSTYLFIYLPIIYLPIYSALAVQPLPNELQPILNLGYIELIPQLCELVSMHLLRAWVRPTREVFLELRDVEMDEDHMLVDQGADACGERLSEKPGPVV